jgi:hypothetical protein
MAFAEITQAYNWSKQSNAVETFPVVAYVTRHLGLAAGGSVPDSVQYAVGLVAASNTGPFLIGNKLNVFTNSPPDGKMVQWTGKTAEVEIYLNGKISFLIAGGQFPTIVQATSISDVLLTGTTVGYGGPEVITIGVATRPPFPNIIIPIDWTPPIVEIKLRDSNGQYAPASQASMRAIDGSLDLMFAVSDPQGVSSILVNFFTKCDSCTLGSVPWQGTFYISGNSLPSNPLQKTLSKQDPIQNQLTLFHTLKGPLTCEILATPPQTGIPYGTTMSVQCVGRNWTADPNNNWAEKTLVINVTS